jgi:hypothetical protein
VSAYGRAHGSGRLGRRILLAFVAPFAVVVAVGAAVVAIVAPGQRSLCLPYRPCGAPPTLSRPLVNLQTWRSSDLGFRLEYPGGFWSPQQQDGRSVTFASGDGSSALLIRGTPAAQASPNSAIAAQLSNLQSNISSLSADTSPADMLLGSSVGFRPGSGGASIGTLNSPQGVQEPALVDSMAATDGKVTISTTLVLAGNAATGNDLTTKMRDDQLADLVINTVTWAP